MLRDLLRPCDRSFVRLRLFFIPDAGIVDLLPLVLLSANTFTHIFEYKPILAGFSLDVLCHKQIIFKTIQSGGSRFSMFYVFKTVNELQDST